MKATPSVVIFLRGGTATELCTALYFVNCGGGQHPEDISTKRGIQYRLILHGWYI